MISQSYKLARRIVVGVVEATVLLLGIAMIVLPPNACPRPCRLYSDPDRFGDPRGGVHVGAALAAVVRAKVQRTLTKRLIV